MEAPNGTHIGFFGVLFLVLYSFVFTPYFFWWVTAEDTPERVATGVMGGSVVLLVWIITTAFLINGVYCALT